MNLAPPKIGKPMDRSTAWACLMTNLLVFPGLGSIVAGRRVGYVQMVLGIAGFGLNLFFILRVLNQWFHWDQDPGPVMHDLVFSMVGLGVFLTAWMWGLVTGLTLMRQTRS
jgi:hypothetical protein